MEPRIIVFGAGGHAVSVLDALRASGINPAFILDDAPEKKGTQLLGTAVRGSAQELPPAELRECTILVAIAVNAARQRVVGSLTERVAGFAGVRHPTATISPFAMVDPTAQVMARVVVNAGARVEAHAVLNTGAIIEHDAHVGAFTHIGPGAVLAGAVVIEEGAFVAAGATVCPFVRLGRGSVLGAGGVALQDVPADWVAVGVPARKLRKVSA